MTRLKGVFRRTCILMYRTRYPSHRRGNPLVSLRLQSKLPWEASCSQEFHFLQKHEKTYIQSDRR